jgi:hypothetical protein
MPQKSRAETRGFLYNLLLADDAQAYRMTFRNVMIGAEKQTMILFEAFVWRVACERLAGV